MTKAIGSMVLAAILIAMPILCVLSFVYSWDMLFKYILVLVTLGEYLILALDCYQRDI